MRNHLLLGLTLVTACSRGDAQPAPKPTEPTAPPATKPEPKPAPAAPAKAAPAPIAKPRELGDRALAGLAAKKVAEIPLELDRKFVSITISPATGKKSIKAFCGDDDMKAWNALPQRLASSYGARLASADPDTLRCDRHGALIFCELAPQDEHEMELTFAIAEESYGPVIAGVAERNTFMVDPDSQRYKADLAERDRELAKATTDDCFKPESSRGREQDR